MLLGLYEKIPAYMVEQLNLTRMTRLPASLIAVLRSASYHSDHPHWKTPVVAPGLPR